VLASAPRVGLLVPPLLLGLRSRFGNAGPSLMVHGA
jgi:hypothetical protein